VVVGGGVWVLLGVGGGGVSGFGGGGFVGLVCLGGGGVGRGSFFVGLKQKTHDIELSCGNLKKESKKAPR